MLCQHAYLLRKLLLCHLVNRYIYLRATLHLFSASRWHLFTHILHFFTGAKVSSLEALILLHIKNKTAKIFYSHLRDNDKENR